MPEAHTPKTEHVRQRYALDVDATSDDNERDYWAAREEFDRWYASALEEAARGAHAALKIQEALAQAWDEGHAEAQSRNGWTINLHDCPNNPYRVKP